MQTHSYYLLRAQWRVLKPITHVTHYQGALWSALFRHAYNPFLANGEAFHQTGLVLHPADYGVAAYPPGARIHLGLAVPAHELPRFCQIAGTLADATLPGAHGQLEPGVTVLLEDLTCRVSARSWRQGPPEPLDAIASPMIDALTAVRRFHLVFHAPLRLTKPKGWKSAGRYADPEFFNQAPNAWQHLLAKLGHDDPHATQLTRVQGAWLNVDYGRTSKPTSLGGFTGVLHISGRTNRDLATTLVRGQFLGLGKNRAFGLGCYAIPQVQHACQLLPLGNLNLVRRPVTNRLPRPREPLDGRAWSRANPLPKRSKTTSPID